jgi:hypothetical protein
VYFPDHAAVHTNCLNPVLFTGFGSLWMNEITPSLSYSTWISPPELLCSLLPLPGGPSCSGAVYIIVSQRSIAAYDIEIPTPRVPLPNFYECRFHLRKKIR